MERVNGLTGEITTPILAQLEAMNDAIDYSSKYSNNQMKIIAQKLLEFKEKEVLEPKTDDHIQAEIHQGFGDVWFDDFHKMELPLYMYHSLVYMWRYNLDIDTKFLGYRFTSIKFKELYTFCNDISYVDLSLDLEAKSRRSRVDVDIREDFKSIEHGSKEKEKTLAYMKACGSNIPWRIVTADINGDELKKKDNSCD